MPIAASALAIASLAACSTAKPEASGSKPTAHRAASTIGAPVSLPPATASMPSSSPSATGKKPANPATSSPASTGKRATGAPGSSSGTGTGNGSGNGSGTGSSGGASCVTSAPQTGCGPYSDPQIQGIAGDPSVTNDIWNPISGWQQTLYVNGPGDWHTVVTGPAGNTAVVSYPDTQSLYNDKSLSSFPALYSSFSENMNPHSGTSGEAAYDIWLNNWSDEVMIMHDMHNIGSDAVYATNVEFGGSHGVPAQEWRLVHNGTELIWQLQGAGEQTGSVDILSMITWLINHGYEKNGSTLTDIDYGFEVCSTGGQQETFTVNGYAVTT
jgi:hypothetical protein